jgi:hypothetical protein
MKKIFGSVLLVAVLTTGCGEDALDIDNSSDVPTWYKPENGVSWFIDLTTTPRNKSVDIYFLKLFSSENIDNIDRIKSEQTKVFCQLPAGSYDSKIEKDFPTGELYPDVYVGNGKSGSSTSYWVDIRADKIVELVTDKIDYASQIGCDGVHFTDVNLHQQSTGFEITYFEQIAFSEKIALESHKRGLAVSFQDVENQVSSLSSSTETILSSECFINGTCSFYEEFAKDKPVFNIEYSDQISTSAQVSELCLHSKAYNLETLILDRTSGSVVNSLLNCSVDDVTTDTESGVGTVDLNDELVVTTPVEESEDTTTTPAKWYQPVAGLSWYRDLGDIPEVKDVDLYFINLYSTRNSINVANMQSNGRTIVYCQIPAGVYNEETETTFSTETLYPEIYVGEQKSQSSYDYWVNIKADTVKDILSQKILYASEIGCDGVNFVDVNLETKDTGFNITLADQIEFNLFLASEAHTLGLSVSFQDVENQIAQISAESDILVSEECFVNGTCSEYESFGEDKPVLDIEYSDSINSDIKISDLYLQSKAYNFSPIIFDRDTGAVEIESLEDYATDNISQEVYWYKPTSGVSWYRDLGDNPQDEDVKVYIIDLFSTDSINNVKRVKENSTTKAFCQLSAGKYDTNIESTYRFSEAYSSNGWIDVGVIANRDILEKRLDYAYDIGCDGVNFIDVNLNTKSTASVTFDEQVEFNQFIGDEAHKRGLSVSYEDVEDQIGELSEFADALVSLECGATGGCSDYISFAKEKPVFNIEYESRDELISYLTDSDTTITGTTTYLLCKDLEERIKNLNDVNLQTLIIDETNDEVLGDSIECPQFTSVN